MIWDWREVYKGCRENKFFHPTIDNSMINCRTTRTTIPRDTGIINFNQVPSRLEIKFWNFSNGVLKSPISKDGWEVCEESQVRISAFANLRWR